jgi:hypothetical protein
VIGPSASQLFQRALRSHKHTWGNVQGTEKGDQLAPAAAHRPVNAHAAAALNANYLKNRSPTRQRDSPVPSQDNCVFSERFLFLGSLTNSSTP